LTEVGLLSSGLWRLSLYKYHCICIRWRPSDDWLVDYMAPDDYDDGFMLRLFDDLGYLGLDDFLMNMSK